MIFSIMTGEKRNFPFLGSMPFEHGRIAMENAELHFGPLSKAEKDAIRHHMWPLSIVPPHTGAAWMVTIADKIITARDIIRWLQRVIKKKIK